MQKTLELEQGDYSLYAELTALESWDYATRLGTTVEIENKYYAIWANDTWNRIDESDVPQATRLVLNYRYAERLSNFAEYYNAKVG